MNSTLFQLQQCQNREHIAELLDIDYKHFCFVLYSQPIHNLYHKALIYKKNGKPREILAPNNLLKNIQQKLALILNKISDEINIRSTQVCYSYRKDSENKFGFHENAKLHVNSKLVINIDLKDFFTNITFSRIVGYFHKNKKIKINYDVAIIIAQIACYKDPFSNKSYLPQGSPCSPMISNFIGTILDDRLFKLANKKIFIYSRYSDDLTFSFTTNSFPNDIVKKIDSNWVLGKTLRNTIALCQFQINEEKIVIRDKYERQQVTGLTVNKKANINVNYYKSTRAMIDKYCKTGLYERSKYHSVGIEFSEESLIGIANHIKNIKGINYTHTNIIDKNLEPLQIYQNLKGFSKSYIDLMFHINFVHHSKIKIICEGKTDPQHIYNYLRNTNLFKKDQFDLISFEKHIRSFTHPLNLSGGTDPLCKFIKMYSHLYKSNEKPKYPTIIFVDNDAAGNSTFNTAKSYSTYNEIKILRDSIRVAFVCKNLYILQWAKLCPGIEYLYPSHVLEEKVEGKILNLSNDKIKDDSEYGKIVFFHQVIKPLGNKIYLGKFRYLCFAFTYIKRLHQ